MNLDGRSRVHALQRHRQGGDRIALLQKEPDRLDASHKAAEMALVIDQQTLIGRLRTKHVDDRVHRIVHVHDEPVDTHEVVEGRESRVQDVRRDRERLRLVR